MHRLHFSPEALRRLEAIHSYSEQRWGTAQAEKFLRMLYERMEHLQTMPFLGKPYKKHRILHVAEHYIVYRLEENILYIMTLLHVTMDVPTQLHNLLIEH